MSRHWAKQNHSKVAPYRQGCLTRVPIESVSKVEIQPLLRRNWPGVEQISLEEEGLFVLDEHRTQKLYLINAMKRGKKILSEIDVFQKYFLRPICFLSCFIFVSRKLVLFYLKSILFFSSFLN